MPNNKFYKRLSVRFSLGFLVLAVLICVTTCMIGYTKYKATIEQQYNESAYALARVAESYVDGDSIAGYLDTLKEDEAYAEMGQRLDVLRASSNANYIFIYVPLGDDIHYIYDAKGANSDIAQIKLGQTDPISVKYKDLVHGIYQSGKLSSSYFISRSEYGYNTSAIIPIRDSKGRVTALLNVDINMKLIESALREYVVVISVLTFAVVCLFIVVFLLYLRQKVIEPIKMISKNAANFVHSQNTFIDDLLRIKTGDEIEDLAESLCKMENDINHYIKSLTQVTADRERIVTELNVATQIQASMLPCLFPAFPEVDEFDIYATMHPAKEVGGDFYDFFLVDSTHLGIVIADVSGKGVPAALFMVITKALIKNQAQTGKTPAEIFTAVNNQLCENNEAGMFVTAFMGVLEVDTGLFTYVNAGHNPPLIKKAGGDFEWLRARAGFVLAGMEQIQYRQAELTLKKGDTLYLYTDGVTEALNTKDELFSDSRLMDILNAEPTKEMNLPSLLNTLRQEIKLFSDGAEQADDITMLALRYVGL